MRSFCKSTFLQYIRLQFWKETFVAGYSFDREIVASQFKFDYIKDSFIDLLIYVSATFKCTSSGYESTQVSVWLGKVPHLSISPSECAVDRPSRFNYICAWPKADTKILSQQLPRLDLIGRCKGRFPLKKCKRSALIIYSDVVKLLVLA